VSSLTCAPAMPLGLLELSSMQQHGSSGDLGREDSDAAGGARRRLRRRGTALTQQAVAGGRRVEDALALRLGSLNVGVCAVGCPNRR
jgi:hypothetical protein